MKTHKVLAIGLMVGLTLLSSVSAFAREVQPGDDRGGRGGGRDAAALQVQQVDDRGQASLEGRESEPGDDSRLVLHERELQRRRQRNRGLGQSVVAQSQLNDDKGGMIGLPEPGDDKGGIQGQHPEPDDDKDSLPGQHPESGDDKGGQHPEPGDNKGDDRGGGHNQGGHA